MIKDFHFIFDLYRHILLNLLKDGYHFFFIFLWPIASLATIRKLIRKTLHWSPSILYFYVIWSEFFSPQSKLGASIHNCLKNSQIKYKISQDMYWSFENILLMQFHVHNLRSIHVDTLALVLFSLGETLPLGNKEKRR
jgi:hypothetical protein